MTPTAVAAYLALFASVGFVFVLASLLLGRLLRASAPTAEKLATYECGEQPVGSAAVQFDLRFYVVALVFLIFEVEVALFFPPAVIFGRATECQRMEMFRSSTPVEADVRQEILMPGCNDSARTLALVAMADLGVFFAVLLVGFAYVWRRSDLDWVRAVRNVPSDPDIGPSLVSLHNGA